MSFPKYFKKETIQLQKVIGDIDITDVLRIKFEKELQGIGQFEVIDGNASEGIYKECCADSMQILFSKRKANAELEKQFEEKLKKRKQLQVDVSLQSSVTNYNNRYTEPAISLQTLKTVNILKHPNP